MTEAPTPADPNSTPEDPDAAPAPNPGEDPGGAVNPAPGPDSGQGDPVDPVQNGAPATGPEAPQPPTS
ncbi:hypothetical protein [Aeromicrobium sp. NPDC092404]|uniref:hypothetical protein n=1 Tax=Aeromicrobium sp. NPDC092404 TaxID=3154976 RepID=UPI0034309A61